MIRRRRRGRCIGLSRPCTGRRGTCRRIQQQWIPQFGRWYRTTGTTVPSGMLVLAWLWIIPSSFQDRIQYLKRFFQFRGFLFHGTGTIRTTSSSLDLNGSSTSPSTFGCFSYRCRSGDKRRSNSFGFVHLSLGASSIDFVPRGRRFGIGGFGCTGTLHGYIRGTRTSGLGRISSCFAIRMQHAWSLHGFRYDAFVLVADIVVCGVGVHVRGCKG